MKRSQQVAHSTANLQDTLTRADEEPIDLLKAVVVGSTQSLPFITFACDHIPMSNMSLLVNLPR
jgi:hypothetical protein